MAGLLDEFQYNPAEKPTRPTETHKRSPDLDPGVEVQQAEVETRSQRSLAGRALEFRGCKGIMVF